MIVTMLFILDSLSENKIIPILWATVYFWDKHVAAACSCKAPMQNPVQTLHVLHVPSSGGMMFWPLINW